MGAEFKYAETTEKIIGCAMTVHRKMKAGYSELIYSRCLVIEFDKIQISYKKELELPIYYDETIVGKRRVDFMVEDKIVVELKAIAELTDNQKKSLAQNPANLYKNPINPRL